MDLTKEDLHKHGLFYSTIENGIKYIRCDDCDPIIRSLIDSVENDTSISIFIPTENHLAHGEFSEKTARIMRKRNIKINFVFGGFYKYNLTEKYDSPDDNRYLHLWPTSTIFDSVDNICRQYKLRDLKENEPKDFVYPYASFSFKAKSHRCYLVDNLVKNKILDRSLYTWYNYDSAYSNYEWRSVDPKSIIRKLDDNFYQTGNFFKMPSEYFKCFAHLVSEGMDDGMFITEKTVIPIMHKKPFIVQGIQNFHKVLKDDLKFELYDEIFDYEFDQWDDFTKRTDAVIENIKRILDEDFVKLYQKLYPKIQYNQNRMLEIVNQKVLVPEIVLKSKPMCQKYRMLKQGLGKI